jgi:hypothetical protein
MKPSIGARGIRAQVVAGEASRGNDFASWMVLPIGMLLNRAVWG